MKKPLYLWLDLETTGLKTDTHGVVEIAGIIARGEEVLETFEFQVKPFSTDEIEDSALECNNKTREQLHTFESPRNVHRKLTAIFNQYVNPFDKTDKFILAGYNVNFDVDFLAAFFKKCQDNYFFSWIWFPVLDVSNIIVHHFPELRPSMKSGKLIDACAFFDIDINEFGNAHEAMTDIYATRELYYRMIQTAEEMRNEEN